VRQSTIARSYAEALFALGERHEQLEPFGAALDLVAATLESEPRLRLFLETPKVEPAEKKRVLTDALRNQVPPLVLNFLLVVLDKRRQRILPQMAREYRVLLDESLGRLYAEVTVAREPDEKMEREIAAGLSQALGKTVIPHIQVDPSILGGIIVRYGDRVLDGSLKRRLVTLRRRLLDAKLSSKSSR
jgi:F-type H+-transporting ATPase subunit delta